MNYRVHVSSRMWRIKNQPSKSTSCRDNALRLLVLLMSILYRGLQVTSSFSIWRCVPKGCFERGIIFQRAKSHLKGIEDFTLEHWLSCKQARSSYTIVFSHSYHIKHHPIVVSRLHTQKEFLKVVHKVDLLTSRGSRLQAMTLVENLEVRLHLGSPFGWNWEVGSKHSPKILLSMEHIFPLSGTKIQLKVLQLFMCI